MPLLVVSMEFPIAMPYRLQRNLPAPVHRRPNDRCVLGCGRRGYLGLCLFELWIGRFSRASDLLSLESVC